MLKIFSFTKFAPQKKTDKNKVFSFRKNLPFFSILFHSRKNFCEQTPVLSVLSLCISLSFKKLFRIFKMNLFRFFCVFLSYKFFFRPFFITSCFCSSRFAFTSFFISFSFDFFSWSPSSWTHFSLLPSLSLAFLNNKFPFFFESKTLQRFTFCVHALPLFVLLFIDLFICCLFFLFVFSLSMTSFWNTYLTLLHFHNLFTFSLDIFTNLYVFACSSFLSLFSPFLCILLFFLDIFLFCSLSWTTVFPMCLFCCPFWMYLSFFEDSLWFDYPFSAFFQQKSFYVLSLSFQKPRFFSKLFPRFFGLDRMTLTPLRSVRHKNHVWFLNCFRVFWTQPNDWMVCCLLLPLFFHFIRKKLPKKIVLTRFETSVFWTLHTHLHQFNIFPYRMSTLPLYFLLLFILFPLVLSFVSPCFLVSFNFQFLRYF